MWNTQLCRRRLLNVLNTYLASSLITSFVVSFVTLILKSSLRHPLYTKKDHVILPSAEKFTFLVSETQKKDCRCHYGLKKFSLVMFIS